MNNKLDVSNNEKINVNTNTNTNINLNKKEIIKQNLKNDEMQKSMMEMNKNLRTDIKLSVAIFKQKNNFQHNYINHNIKNALGK